MDVRLQIDAGSLNVSLSGDLVVRNVKSLFQKVNAAMEDVAGVGIHLDGVRDVDSSGVQLLLHFIMQSDANGRPIQIISPPPSLVRLIDAYGLESIFSEVIKNRNEGTEGDALPSRESRHGSE